jgi:predicted dinucleotide-binding enzyme
MTTIAVIGRGNVGGTLGRAWSAAGHDVRFGGRDDASAAAGEAEVVVFAVPGSAMEALLASVGPALGGKVVIDATNDMQGSPPSSVHRIAAIAPDARVFRAFNSVGWENMADPVFGGVQADLLYCGADNATATDTVEQLVADVGFRPVRVGGLDEVATVDGLLQLWFALAVRGGRGRRLAFKILTD